MPKGSRRKKTRKQIPILAHQVNKRVPKSKKETQLEAKNFVKQNKKSLFKIQKTKRVQKKKKNEALRKKVFESEKEKKIVSRFTKKKTKKRKQEQKNEKSEQPESALKDPWEDENQNKFKSKWEDKPQMPQMKKARNPAIMMPKSGESHNPSQGAYSEFVNSLFDKGKTELGDSSEEE